MFTSIFPLLVSLSIVSEITGSPKKKIKKLYAEVITDDMIPLAVLTHESQDLYVSDYLLRNHLLDLDLLRLSNSAQNPLTAPLLSNYTQSFFQETAMMREANRIISAYAADRTITQRLTTLALSNGISYRTLVRKRRLYMNHSNLMRLLDDPFLGEDIKDRYRTCCFYARDYVVYRHLSAGRPSDRMIFRELRDMEPFPCSSCPYSKSMKSGPHKKTDYVPKATCARNCEHMVVPHLDDTVNLITNRISDQETCLAWEGVRSWASKYHFTPSRKRPEKINAVWFSDHTKLDLFVITKRYPDGTFDTARVWLTGIMDAASNALVGYVLSTNPNSDCIAQAFARAAAFKVDCPYYGLPEVFYIDNGRDYCAKLLKGASNKTDEPLYLNKDFGESGILEWFGVRTIHALPYRGCSKTIERIWGMIESFWISDLPGYCGSSPSKKPVTLEQDKKTGDLYTFEQFADYFADTIYPAYNRYADGHPSPEELYCSLPRANTLVPTWKTLAVLRSKNAVRTISSSGIQYSKRFYWCAALAPFIGQEVRIFTFDTPFNRSIAVTLNRVYIGEAHLIDQLNVVEQQRYRVIQHLQEQRAHYKTISKHLKEIHSVILQTDVLERGTHVPAIDTITYGQAIDEGRDSVQGQDDARIPAELKEQAIQYLAQKATQEQPGIASQFIRQLGEQSTSGKD